MNSILKNRKETIRYLVVVASLSILCFLTYFFEILIKVHIIYSHLFYFPIILGCYWWKKKGLIVPFFLSGILIFFSFLGGGTVIVIIEGFVRTIIFTFVGFSISFLSQIISKNERYLRESNEMLEQHVKDRTADLVLTNKKLNKTQEQLNSIFSSLKDTVFVISEDYKILFKNETAHDIFGKELIGKDCYKVIKGKNQVCERCPMKTFAESDLCQVRFEQCVNTPFLKEERVFDIVTSPIESYAGQPAIVEMIRDITENKHAEEELRKAKTFSESIIDSLPGIFYFFDEKGKFLRWNKNFEEVSEYSSEEISRMSILDFFREKDKKIMDSRIQEVFIKGKSTAEAEFTSKSGENNPYYFTGLRIMIGNIPYLGGMGINIAERKKAEEELKEHRDHLEYMVVERTKELNCLYGLSKLIEEKNITKEEILKRTVELLPHAWKFPDITYARIIIDGQEYKTENFKETKWKQVSDITIDNEKLGTIEIFYLEEKAKFDEGPFLKEERSLIDAITERLGRLIKHINAEKELAKSERLLSTTLRSIGDAVIATDTKGNISFLNPVAESLTGWKQEEAKEKPVEKIFNIINEETHKIVENPVLRVIREGIVVGLANHTILIAKNGNEIPIADSGAPIKDDEGNMLGVVLIFRDITERRKAEQQLRESKERLTTFMESATEGFMIFDKELFLLEINNPGLKILSMSKENMIDKNILEISPGLKKTGRYEEYLKVLKTGEPFHIDEMIPHPKFGEIYMSLSAFKAGEGLGIIFSDITKRMKAEDALKESEKNLKEYSEKLEEILKELRDTQEELVRKERLAVLGQLAGGVSHELRNPLGAIKNATFFLNMVMEEPEPEVKETLEILEREVKSSEKIINSLLSFARPKSLVIRKVEINDIIREVLSRSVIPKNVELINKLAKSLPSIFADPDQLKQVFGNIILNATQAMSKGGQLIVKSEVQNQNYIAISINDSGVGISEENQEKLFKPLFTTKAKGIGLGLAICKTIVEDHGGSIETKSELGRGSIFLIKLPIKRMEMI